MNAFLWQNLEPSETIYRTYNTILTRLLSLSSKNISNRLALIDAQTNVNAVLASFEAFTLLQLQQENAFEQAQFFV